MSLYKWELPRWGLEESHQHYACRTIVTSMCSCWAHGVPPPSLIFWFLPEAGEGEVIGVDNCNERQVHSSGCGRQTACARCPSVLFKEVMTGFATLSPDVVECKQDSFAWVGVLPTEEIGK
jgi:hypothetical protein